MNSFYNDPSGQKIVSELYRWNVPTDREGYNLSCLYLKRQDELEGDLHIQCLKACTTDVLFKRCIMDDIDKYVDYVKGYINNYP